MDKKNLLRLFYILSSPPFLMAAALTKILDRSITEDLNGIANKIKSSPQTKFNKTLIELLITAEDHRYNLHFGVDPIAIARAIIRIVINRRIEGGSTIEQQFVRTCTGYRSRTLPRKLREIILATLISRSHSKESIAYSYLSIAHFGINVTGYKTANKIIHNKTTRKSTMEFHCASLVALLKRPLPSDVNKNNWTEKYKNRIAHIVRRHAQS